MLTDVTTPDAVPADPPGGEPSVPVLTIDVAGMTTEIVTVAVPEATPASPAVNESPDPPADEKTPAEPVTDATSEAEPPVTSEPENKTPSSILMIDIGGTKVKILATGQTEPRKAASGKGFTPGKLVETVRDLAHDWEYEAISIGYPGLVGGQGPRSEPANLGPGWVGFDFAAAFGKPVKMVNDAAMQALGSYEGGRMLFLGLGTGVGSALIAGNLIVPLELGRLPYDPKRTLGEVLGRRGLERLGKPSWREAVNQAVTSLMGAFVADYVVIGGGNAKQIKELPPGARRGHNLTAFRGGIRLWNVEDVWVLAAYGGEHSEPTAREALRML
jgi:polyphosphate glucokinase